MPVDTFQDILIFYIPRPECIEVVRVLHGKRDIGGLFADDAQDSNQ